MTREQLFDKYQESICDHCERTILYCKSMTSTFVCEGSRCNEALDSWLEDNFLGIQINRKIKLKRILNVE